MKTYIIDKVEFIQSSAPYPSFDDVLRAILENNTEVKIIKNNINELVIQCENTPRDMPVYGLKWVEL